MDADAFVAVFVDVDVAAAVEVVAAVDVVDNVDFVVHQLVAEFFLLFHLFVLKQPHTPLNKTLVTILSKDFFRKTRKIIF